MSRPGYGKAGRVCPLVAAFSAVALPLVPFQLVAPMIEAMHDTYVLLSEMDRRCYIGPHATCALGWLNT